MLSKDPIRSVLGVLNVETETEIQSKQMQEDMQAETFSMFNYKSRPGADQVINILSEKSISEVIKMVQKSGKNSGYINRKKAGYKSSLKFVFYCKLTDE